MNNTAFIMGDSGDMTIFHNNQEHSIHNEHPNYDAILETLKSREYDLLDGLLDVAQSYQNNIQGLEITAGGDVIFNGETISGRLADRMVAFSRDGGPIESLIAFFNNIMENPSGRAVRELYGFLENQKMPITEDGCFLAYKGVANDYMDIHSGKFDNSIGQIHEVPRNQVDDDCNNTCSYGFHVGSSRYANSWARSDGRLLVVKVNPRDAVSVPNEHGAEKLRVCRYEVIGEITRREPERVLNEGYVSTCEIPDYYEDEDTYEDEW